MAPSEDKRVLCINCGWEIAEGDLFCGNCGRHLYDVDVRMLGGPIYADIGGPQKRILRVSNQGIIPIFLGELETASWIGCDAAVIPEKPILQGSFLDFQLSIDVSAAIRTGYENQTVNGSVTLVLLPKEEKKDIQVAVLPSPDLFLKGFESIPYQVGCSFEISVGIQRGKVKIIKIEVDENDCIDGDHLEFEGMNKYLKADDDFLSLVCWLKKDFKPKGDSPENINFRFHIDGRTPLEIPIKLNFKIVPTVDSLDGESSYQASVLESRKTEYTLHVKNPYDDEIEIIGIHAKGQGDLVQFRKVDGSEGNIYKIAPGEHASLIFELVGITASSGQSFPTIISVETNSVKGEFTKNFTLNVEVKKLEIYKHWVAIDFGTTNSCAAYYNVSNGTVELVELEDIINPVTGVIFRKVDVIPSAICYTLGPDDEIEPYAGIRSEDYDTDPNYIRSIKRELGKEDKISLKIDEKELRLMPQEIARDIISFIIAKVEERIQRKVVQCIICHPAKFQFSQINDLRWILKNLGIERAQLIDEASAAAFDYIKRRLQIKGKNDAYSLVVYDFGGGTIDITCCEVKVDFEDEFSSVTIKSAGVDGERLFGGDNVTQKLSELIVGKHRAINYCLFLGSAV